MHSSFHWTNIDFNVMQRFNLHTLDLRDAEITKSMLDSFLDVVISPQKLVLIDVKFRDISGFKYDRGKLSNNMLESFYFKLNRKRQALGKTFLKVFFNGCSYDHLESLTMVSNYTQDTRSILTHTPNLVSLDVRYFDNLVPSSAFEFLTGEDCPVLTKLTSLSICRIDRSVMFHVQLPKELLYDVLQEKLPSLKFAQVEGGPRSFNQYHQSRQEFQAKRKASQEPEREVESNLQKQGKRVKLIGEPPIPGEVVRDL
jgi:hypothetical protein